MLSLIRIADRSYFRNDETPLPPRYYWTSTLLPPRAPSGNLWVKPVFLGGSLNATTGEITGSTWTESAATTDRYATVSEFNALSVTVGAKANTSDVDTALGTKANAADVTTALSGKAPAAGAWTALPTLSAGFSAGATAPQYRINNGTVEFRGKLVIAALLAAGTLRQVTTMPSGARPALTTGTETARVSHVINNNMAIGLISCTQAGALSVGAANGYAANDIIDLTGLSYAI